MSVNYSGYSLCDECVSYGLSVNYLGYSLYDECVSYIMSVNYSGYSLYDNCTCMEAVWFLNVYFCEHAIQTASVNLFFHIYYCELDACSTDFLI